MSALRRIGVQGTEMAEAQATANAAPGEIRAGPRTETFHRAEASIGVPGGTNFVQLN